MQEILFFRAFKYRKLQWAGYMPGKARNAYRIPVRKLERLPLAKLTR
jgi:hypothetical protein